MIEPSLKDSEARYRRLFEAAQDGILILDARTGMIEDVNPYLIKMLGYSREEFIKKKLWEVGAFQDIEASKEAFEALQEKEYIRYEDLPLKTKDGRLIQVEFVSNVYLVGGEKVVQCDIRDITEHRRVEDAHLESDARFRRLVERLPTVIYTNAVDDANTPLYISPHIKVLLGYTPEEWLADPKLWSKTLHPDDRQHVLTQAAETNQNNKSFDMEYRMIARDGHTVWVHDQFILVTDLEGQPSFWQGIMLEITGHKQADEELQKSEKRFRALVEHSLEEISLVDSDGTLTWESPTSGRPLGYPPNSFVGHNLFDLFHPDERPAATRLLEQIVKHPGSVQEALFRLQHQDGSWRWMEGILTNLLDEPAVQSVVINYRDITERKQAEESLRRSEEKYRDLVNAVNDGVFVCDDRGVLTYANQALARIHGFERTEELVGRTFIEFVAPAMVGKITQVFRESIQSGTTVETIEAEIIRPNGIGAFIEIKPVPILEDGKVMGIRGVVRDVTERKYAEEAIRLSEEKYHTLVDEVSDGFYVTNEAGVFTFANSALARMYGVEGPQILVGRKYSDFVAADMPLGLDEAYSNAMKTGRSPEVINSRVVQPDGTRIFIEIKPTMIVKGGQIVGTRGVVRDVSERKQAEEKIRLQLEHLTALSAIDQVIASIFDLELCLSEILIHITKELGIDAADILTLNSNSSMLVFGAEHGFRTTGIRKAQIGLGESYAGRAVLERQLVQIPNLRDEPNNLILNNFSAGEDFVCYYGVPLIAKGHVNGVLEIFHRATFGPDAEWFAFLNALAGRAAIAIENSALYESLQRSSTELSMAYDATIEGWSHALDLRDKETEGHTQRVTELTVNLARLFGLSEADLVQVRWGALLHDIGKMGVPDGILLKPEPLTDEEWVAMKKHPAFAYEMLAPIRYLRLALDIPYCHHEKWDGSGYPRGLKGEQIPLVARIFAVVDVWDALNSDRPYRPAWPEEKVLDNIRSLSGTHFDPQVVKVCLESRLLKDRKRP